MDTGSGWLELKLLPLNVKIVVVRIYLVTEFVGFQNGVMPFPCLPFEGKKRNKEVPLKRGRRSKVTVFHTHLLMEM